MEETGGGRGQVWAGGCSIKVTATSHPQEEAPHSRKGGATFQEALCVCTHMCAYMQKCVRMCSVQEYGGTRGSKSSGQSFRWGTGRGCGPSSQGCWVGRLPPQEPLLGEGCVGFSSHGRHRRDTLGPASALHPAGSPGPRRRAPAPSAPWPCVLAPPPGPQPGPAESPAWCSSALTPP